MVAAPYKKHQNDMNKWVPTHRSHTGVKLRAKQLNIFGFNRWLKKNSHYRTFHLKNDSDSDKNWQFTWKREKFHNMGVACLDYNHL
jgi:hypothetical protein